jgi:signal peptidase
MAQGFNKEKAKKIASIAGNVLIWAFVVFSFVITVLVFSAQGSADGVPAIFGKSLITVSTDSMKGTFNSGDLIFMEKLDPIEKVTLSAGDPELKNGDVITFRAPIDIDGDGKTGDLNTHRIIEVVYSDVANGKAEYITQGDANLTADNVGDDPYTVQATDIVGIWTGGRLPGIGKVINFLRSSLGFFLFIVLPLVAFFIYELYRFIAILLEEKRKKNPAAQISKEDEEEIKRKAIEEYLRHQAEEAKRAAEANTEAAATEEAAETTEEK